MFKITKSLEKKKLHLQYMMNGVKNWASAAQITESSFFLKHNYHEAQKGFANLQHCINFKKELKRSIKTQRIQNGGLDLLII